MAEAARDGYIVDYMSAAAVNSAALLVGGVYTLLVARFGEVIYRATTRYN